MDSQPFIALCPSTLHGHIHVFNENHVIEKNKAYPISINGKTRTNMEFPIDMSKEDIESQVLQNEVVLKWLDGNSPKKVIVVPGRIVNIVI